MKAFACKVHGSLCCRDAAFQGSKTEIRKGLTCLLVSPC